MFVDDSLDARRLLRVLARRVRFLLAVSAGAALLTLIASLLLPKQYTAVSSVLIDAPAGSDPRMAIAVNPAYLESLRAYELLAASDSLFLRAVEQFHLRGSQPLDRLKQRILRVAKIRDTRVVSIAVTLPDPKQAQAVAQFIAEQTVSSSRAAMEASDADLIQTAQSDLTDAQLRLQREQQAWASFRGREPEQPLAASIETLTEARTLLASDLLDARSEANQARVQALEDQDTRFERRIHQDAEKLEARNAVADSLSQKRDAALASFNAAAQRLRDVRALSGMRGERLRVFDPGVVPDRPSSPNVALNTGVAFLAGLLCAAVYVALTFAANSSPFHDH
jgi:capsular polysaccharide biosynthesis protein